MGRFLEELQPEAAMLLRLTLGAAMLYSGWYKVVPHGGLHAAHPLGALQYWQVYVGYLGMPAWMGTASALIEFFGGILLLLGLFTRFTALLVVLNMAIAIWKVNSHQGIAGSQYSAALLVMALMLATTGSGALALDRRWGWS